MPSTPYCHPAPTALLLAILALPAAAEVELETRFGTGPDAYRSREAKATADLPRLPLNLELRRFVADTEGSEVVDEKSAELRWTPTDWLLASVQRKSAAGDVLDTRADEYGVSLNVSTLWNGHLDTRLELGLGTTRYRAATGGPAVRRALNRRLPDAERQGIGVGQDLSDTLGVSIHHDRYDYDKDPELVARSIVRRLRRPNSAVFEVLSFPDRSTAVGLHWRPSERWTLDLSRHRTLTVLEQRQDGCRFDVAFRPHSRYEIAAAVARSRSATLRRPNGAVLVEASAGTYYELAGLLHFD